METVMTAKVLPWEEKANHHKHKSVRCCSCRDQLSMAKVEAGEVQCTKCEQAEEHAQNQQRYRQEQAEEEKRIRVEEVMETLKPILMDIYDALRYQKSNCQEALKTTLEQLKDKLENL